MKRAAVLLLLVVPLGSASQAVARAETEISLDQYRARLGLALAALRTSDADPGSSIQAAVDALGLPVTVGLPDGTTVLVTSGSLLGGAVDHADVDAVAALSNRVQLALDGARATSSAPVPDRARIDEAMSHAYEGLQPVRPSWSERLLADVGQVLGWLLDHTLGTLARSGVGGVVGWILVLALVGAAFLVTRRVRRGVVHEARWTGAGMATASVDWRRVAEEALAAGDLGAAVPALYHVLLAALDARGVVRDAPALTAGECRRAVHRTRPTLGPAIDDATEAFERVVYGKRPAEPDDVTALQTADRVVRRS